MLSNAMTSPPLVLDGLWRCLCPSFTSQISPRILSSVRIPSALHSPRRFPTSQCPASWRAPTRSFSIAADPNPPYLPGSRPLRAFNGSQSKNIEASLVHLSTPELYERLRAEAASGRHRDVMKIVKILLKDREQEPSLQMYSAILHSYVSAEDGTAGMIRKTLEEMRQEGIELDSRACHNILEALAVHPDYLLRTEILEYMKERWFTLTDTGHNHIVAGLLRDRCFEQALEKMDTMTQDGIPVAPWVYDVAMYLLLDNREVEEAYQLARVRQNSKSKTMSYALWMHLLDCASKLHHPEAVNFVWNSQVVPSYLRPPTGTCLHILNMAGRSGDVRLATEVFRVLIERGTAFSHAHYEMLLEAYLNAGDLKAALSVLLIMQETGLKVTEGAVLPLYNYLIKDPARPMEAFLELQSLEHSDRQVPTAAVNSCIQALIRFSRLEDAIEIYKVLHTVSRAGPNTATFNILFQGCHRDGREELAIFLVKEMLALRVEPDAMSYDRLILISCSVGKVEDAMLYYGEMKDLGFMPRRGTLDLLIKKGVEARHPMTATLLDDMKESGYQLSKEMQRLIEGLEQNGLQIGISGGNGHASASLDLGKGVTSAAAVC
ncbi:hypothetical protein GQ43DRAFT_394612 [Delitschia confertaspora ATCC 74209]|uniref:Pentatricopeptide repeat-containing protein-mitochondrial domain-containing protein n=1 Tax=Delitschia confertaspora ATCC 74209 TaxID=1513339 RepID=A0A9P4JLE4_9PLEO|nr:hypothetical protein GQ43DRAFT_394612 [Delitschia confertaspora ATCC 74209]